MTTRSLFSMATLGTLLLASGCASSGGMNGGDVGARLRARALASVPNPDPRIGLGAGIFDAEEAAWNLRLVSTTPPSSEFVAAANTDLAFAGNVVFQGSYGGFQMWDISDPSNPTLVRAYPCPAAQSDVSTYRNLLFVSGEDYSARLDCGTEGARGQVNLDRLRGIRIFDITDVRNPRYIGNVQTCRGSHTHSVVENPRDPSSVYIYVSGSSPVRSPEELAGCSNASPLQDPNSSLFRIEVIRVPLSNPEQAAIVSSPRIFDDLVEPETHGPAPAELAEKARLEAEGAFVVEVGGELALIPPEVATMLLDTLVARRGGTGRPTAADTATLREMLPAMVEASMAGGGDGPAPGPTQCHDITVYSAIGLAGGACEGYGFLLDISDPVSPRRLTAVADSNFSYWHSATFNNAGTRVLFTDEWGGGTGPKCRADDPKEWGADAFFDIVDRRELRFLGYYKLPAAQSAVENCVAHNGSMLPIPGRDVMVQSWYQGGISVFDWTDPTNPQEIAFHDRGPMRESEMVFGGTWSVYWYNGVIVSSEIGRGLDVFELEPSEFLTQNEIDAANTVRLEYLNAQTQPRFEWPATFALARAYVDQLERASALDQSRVESARAALRTAESASGAARTEALNRLAGEMDSAAGGSSDAAKVRALATTVRALNNG